MTKFWKLKTTPKLTLIEAKGILVLVYREILRCAKEVCEEMSKEMGVDFDEFIDTYLDPDCCIDEGIVEDWVNRVDKRVSEFIEMFEKKYGIYVNFDWDGEDIYLTIFDVEPPSELKDDGFCLADVRLCGIAWVSKDPDKCVTISDDDFDIDAKTVADVREEWRSWLRPYSEHIVDYDVLFRWLEEVDSDGD